MISSVRACAPLLALVWISTSVADPAVEDRAELAEIVVTADPLSAIEAHLARPVSVLDADALKRESLASIGETVANMPGINASDFGASVSRPVIRGLGGARVRVLENGIGTMDVATVSADHGVAVEPIFAQQIEVFRGPATLLYGSGASGGLVNVVNGRIPVSVPQTLGGGLYSHYDSAANGWLGAWQIELPLAEALALHVDGLRRDSGDLDIPGYAAVSPEPDARRGRLENSSAETDNHSVGLGWSGSRGHVGFNVSYLANIYGVPGAHSEEEELPVAADADGISIAIEQTRYDTEAALDIGILGVERLRTRWGYADYAHDEVEADGAVATRFNNEEIEGRVELIHQPLGVFDGVIGLQYGNRTFSAIGAESYVPPSAQDSLAGFVFEKADFGALHLDAGLRYERLEARNRVSAAAVTRHLVSVSAGGSYAYRPGWSLGLALTRSQRAPTIEELFALGPHNATNTFERGNLQLGEETTHNVDVSWRKAAGGVRFEAAVFYSDIGDFVYLAANDLNGDGVADRVAADYLATGLIVNDRDALLLLDQRQRDAQMWGFELAADFDLIDDRRGRLDLRLWSDYVDGELSGGTSMPRLPPWRLGLRLDWRRARWSCALAVTRVSDVSDPAPLETPTDGFVMINADLGYAVPLGDSRVLDIFARASNLADQTVRRHSSFVKDIAPRAGIGGVIGARLSF